MQYPELAVAGAWEITPKQFTDPRGVFLEWFRQAPPPTRRDALGAQVGAVVGVDSPDTVVAALLASAAKQVPDTESSSLSRGSNHRRERL